MSNDNQKNLTLRMLLENPQLLEVSSKNTKESSKGENDYENSSAFLGPTIWQNTIPSEFLDLPTDMLESVDVSAWLNEQIQTTERKDMTYVNHSGLISMDYESNMSPDIISSTRFGNKSQFEVEFHESPDMYDQDTTKNCTILTSDGSIYDSNSNSALPILPVASTLKISMPLKAIVGDDSFDPSKRSFTSDELRVAPILPKSQKNFVPSDKKDDHYWTRRLKNNTAAKRSREAKRMKENQITLRTAYLEQENAKLKEELARANAEKMELKKRLKKYECVSD